MCNKGKPPNPLAEIFAEDFSFFLAFNLIFFIFQASMEVELPSTKAGYAPAPPSKTGYAPAPPSKNGYTPSAKKYAPATPSTPSTPSTPNKTVRNLDNLPKYLYFLRYYSIRSVLLCINNWRWCIALRFHFINY